MSAPLGNGEPFTDRQAEIAAAKTRFSVSFSQEAIMSRLIHSGAFGNYNDDDHTAHQPAFEPIYAPAPRGRWLWGVRYEAPPSNRNGTLPHVEQGGSLSIAHFSGSRDVIAPHPELIQALEIAEIEPTHTSALVVARIWEQGWNHMVTGLSGKIMFAANYTVTHLDPGAIEQSDPYL
jgi:hypothetical protein